MQRKINCQQLGLAGSAPEFVQPTLLEALTFVSVYIFFASRIHRGRSVP